MLIFPAIDLFDGKAVRLTKGDYGKKEVFGEPCDFAGQFKAAGAKHLHVVDLNGARSGETENFDVVKRLAESGLDIQIGGGVRSPERIARYLDAGVKRVIIGTAAVTDRAFLVSAIADFGEAVAVGVDAKNGFTAINGWEKVTQIPSFEFCGELAALGVRTIVYTDVDTDGMMSGTNLEAFARLTKIEGLNVIASGGVTYYEEITALRDMGAYGVILGKAIYKNLLRLDRAIAAAEER